MTLYSFVLFTHVTAVLALFTCLSLETLSLFHLRRASTLTGVQPWIEPVPGLSAIALGSLLVILLSGIHLTIEMSGFALAWPKVTVGAFLLMAPLGAMTGRRMRAIRHAYADAKMINSELLTRLQDRFLKISLGIRIAVFLGILLLMAAQPELWESISVVAASVVLGLLGSLPSWRRGGSLSAPSGDLTSG
jgi:hypothetical protein